MNGAPSYPASLRISESAKERIRSLVKEVETCNPGVSFFAEVYWATAVRGRQTSSGPAIGVWEAGEVSDRDMQVVDGLKLVANLDASSWRHFENKTLDYVGGRLMLVEPE